MERPVRVRFAPSPTGPLHIGGVRTALYNYLFARRHGGTMILRIEDTDSQRFVPGAEEYILESLKWCGIEIDEGVGVGGPHAPYRQSERRDIYLKYAKQLVESGWAYYAFDTAEELDALRKEYEARGETFAYNYSIREKLPTSLSLSKEEVAARIARGDQWVIRFKMPENEIVEMDDLIRGHVEVNTSTLDDKVLYKSADALPTYHLANIVDDRLMEVSHVIRGEEGLGGAAGVPPADAGKVINGGPMMGRAMVNLASPVTKGCSGITVMSGRDAQRREASQCIKCAKCVAACPMGLEPYYLSKMTQKKGWEEVEAQMITSCIECGCCQASCPSYLPLLDWVRLGKQTVMGIIRARAAAPKK